jgi:DNA polymerase
VAAQAIYNCEYDDIIKDDPRRQVGKVAELALGYQGGSGAFQAMARGYEVIVGKSDAERIKDKWRKANPWAVKAWKNYETAAMRAVKNPGTRYNTGRVSYFCVAGILVGAKTLFCELPCGRLLTYPDVRLEMVPTPWGEERLGLTAMRSNWTPKATEKEWPRSSLYGGLLCENATQATAASLLRYALRAALEAGLKVVLHVHDELVVECAPNAKPDMLHAIMNTAPAWAEGLPLHAPVDFMRRFGK